ncbi:type III secretion system inner rod subunit SctI [Pseudomonas sp. 681]|jgi:type III secretion system YscI/HrpB-like protein|uniref:Type III secretion system inner rod subunit SctI n=1 Tax=Pseudomonas fungipugnans TaxID=3024217 RepID=A0ABT6QJF9_9PSED|nr:type III secretion system inner rod subunit SctI [Pseudomonas sp. 681]MDI2591023.1 type III secretion system inner rod subunit SctI [Pseudomonas sp. 681]
MAITGITANHSGLAGSEAAPGRPPAEADIAWFNVQMQQVAARAPHSEPQNSPMTQATSALQKDADKATRDLQRAARSTDPQQALQANRSLSSFYLESLLGAKLVSKAAQSVEKLTSLQ